MAYFVIRRVKGHYYLYEQESYREGKHVRTRSRYIGAVNQISTDIPNSPPKPIKNIFQNEIDLPRYKISIATLEQNYLTFLNCLTKMGIDVADISPITLKYGETVGFKKNFSGSYTVYLPKNQNGNRSKFQKAFRKALSFAGLDLIQKHHPLNFDFIKQTFQESYRQTQNALNTYILNTNDYNRTIKAVALKRYGIYYKTYKNPLHHEDLGLTEEKRTNWRDEYGDLMAQILQKTYPNALTDWEKRLFIARATEKAGTQKYIDKKKSRLIKIGLKREKKAMTRAIARRRSLEEIIKRLIALQKVFRF